MRYVAGFLVAIALVIAIASWHGSTLSYGTEIKFGLSTLYYTSKVHRADAERFGQYLVDDKFFTDELPMSVQLDLVNRRYVVRVLIKLGRENNLELERNSRAMGQHWSEKVFDKAPVDIDWCDRGFKTFRTIVYEPLKPDLPVSVTFRRSIGRGGLVAQFHNNSQQILTVKAYLSNKTLNAAKLMTLELVPGRKVEVGWAEGWNFTSGETILVEHADHESMKLTVP